MENNKEEYTFAPKINKPNEKQGQRSTKDIKGMEKTMERMQRAREEQMNKKMATERGMPNQLQQRLVQGEPKMYFGSNTDKYKSVFGTEGSQINPRAQKDFSASQKINKTYLQKGARETRNN